MRQCTVKRVFVHCVCTVKRVADGTLCVRSSTSFFQLKFYISESGWYNVWQTFSTDCIYRDSHPLLVPVLQKKKCSKSGKKISKERSREISWSVLILYLCICKTQIQLIMLSFQFRLKDDRDIDDLLSFIEGPCSKVTNEKKKKVKKSAK